MADSSDRPATPFDVVVSTGGVASRIYTRRSVDHILHASSASSSPTAAQAKQSASERPNSSTAAGASVSTATFNASLQRVASPVHASAAGVPDHESIVGEARSDLAVLQLWRESAATAANPDANGDRDAATPVKDNDHSALGLASPSTLVNLGAPLMHSHRVHRVLRCASASSRRVARVQEDSGMTAAGRLQSRISRARARESRGAHSAHHNREHLASVLREVDDPELLLPTEDASVMLAAADPSSSASLSALCLGADAVSPVEVDSSAVASDADDGPMSPGFGPRQSFVSDVFSRLAGPSQRRGGTAANAPQQISFRPIITRRNAERRAALERPENPHSADANPFLRGRNRGPWPGNAAAPGVRESDSDVARRALSSVAEAEAACAYGILGDQLAYRRQRGRGTASAGARPPALSSSSTGAGRINTGSTAAQSSMRAPVRVAAEGRSIRSLRARAGHAPWLAEALPSALARTQVAALDAGRPIARLRPVSAQRAADVCRGLPPHERIPVAGRTFEYCEVLRPSGDDASAKATAAATTAVAGRR